MTQAAPIRTAVLGYGVSGRVFHAPFIAANADYSLDVISTGNADRARLALQSYPGMEIVSSPDEVLERANGLDLVIIGTPPSTHYDLARAAIEAGLNVVVDKPFVPTSAQGLELIELAANVGVALTVFQNRRWDADFLTLRSILASGELGDVYTFESRFETWKPAGFRDWKAEATIAEGGGILFDLGSHLIDQALQLFGPIDTERAGPVHAESRRHWNQSASDADEDTVVSLRHASGVVSRLTMNGISALPAPRFHLLGSRAAYTKWGLDTQEPTLVAGMLPTDPQFGIDPEANWGVLGTPESSRVIEPERGAYSEFYRLLAGALLAGEPLPVDPADSIEVLRIIEEAHRVARA